MKVEELTERVFARTAELAGLSRDEINGETTLESAGLDSSDAVILAMEVEELTGREVDVGIFLRFENLGQAIDELARLMEIGSPATGPVAAGSNS
jgi:acyl carrier protein